MTGFSGRREHVSILNAAASMVGDFIVATPPAVGLSLTIQKKLVSRLPSEPYSICDIHRDGAKD